MTTLTLLQAVTDIVALTNVDASPLPHVSTDGQIRTIISIVLGIIGALALLMITIGGIRYIVSEGDPQGVSKAKSTIIYALIGLIVVISAQVIVTFVLTRTT